MADGAPKRDFKEDLLREQVRLAITQIPTMQTTSVVVAFVLAYVVRDLVPRGHIIAWCIMVLTVAISRGLIYAGFLKVRREAFAAAYWRNACLLSALLSGIVWGLSAFIIFPAHDPERVALFVLVMTSLAAATTISHSSLRLGSAAWAVPAMALYAVRCYGEGGEVEYTISFLILLYLYTIVNYSFKHHRAILSAVSLKFENLELLDEVRRANDILRLASTMDVLTELANRYSFEEVMDREWRRAIRDRSPISLVMLDIDHFKAYNDNYGHQGGDDCLRKVAAVLASSIRRPADLAARYGGEEFMIVLPETDLRGARELAEKLRADVEALAVPHTRSSAAPVVTISAGVASVMPEQGMSASHLVKLVDTALYAAKNEGRNRVKAA